MIIRKRRLFDKPPPGAGFRTDTGTSLADKSSSDGTRALRLELSSKRVSSSRRSNFALESLMNLVPFMERVSPGLPAWELSGTMLSILGRGFSSWKTVMPVSCPMSATFLVGSIATAWGCSKGNVAKTVLLSRETMERLLSLLFARTAIRVDRLSQPLKGSCRSLSLL